MRLSSALLLATGSGLLMSSGGCGAPAPYDPGTVTCAQVQKIFDSHCAISGCHASSGSPATFAGDLDLTAAQMGPCSINTAASQDPSRMRIAPGSADASYLMCKVDPACNRYSGAAMPIGAPLSTQEIETLRAWINQGAAGCTPGVCSSTPTGGADTTAPTFAGATTATSAPNSITVSWNAASDSVTAAAQMVYLLYQSTTPGGESYTNPSFTTVPGATSYTVGKLPINSKYYYVVRARDGAGNIDTNKVEVNATTPAQSDMQAPAFSGVQSAAVSGSSITLQWNAATDNVTAAGQIVYLVYQASSAGGQAYATPTYTTAPGATSFVVSGLAANTTYYFVVRAQDGAGNIDANTKESSAKTASLSFAGQVQPILTANCGGAACHSGNKPAQGLDLGSAAASYAALVNVASAQCTTTKRVLPSQPTMSYLIWKLQGSGTCFTGSRMPKGAPLSAADMGTISAWIASGAPNN